MHTLQSRLFLRVPFLFSHDIPNTANIRKKTCSNLLKETLVQLSSLLIAFTKEFLIGMIFVALFVRNDGLSAMRVLVQVEVKVRSFSHYTLTVQSMYFSIQQP